MGCPAACAAFTTLCDEVASDPESCGPVLAGMEELEAVIKVRVRARDAREGARRA